jgi:hypothetical protein
LLAQELETVFPNLVRENVSPPQYDSLGNVVVESVHFKVVDYTKLSPVLIAGHKGQSQQIHAKDEQVNALVAANEALAAENANQQRTIDDLNDRLTQLENCLRGILPSLCEMGQQSIKRNEKETQEELRHIIEVELQNGTAIVLNQNVPNPFAESTVITYSIPETVNTAQIIFSDATGALIKTVDIRERGNGQLNVYANDLSSGVYTYSLIADGKIVATKRMVRE